MKYLRMIATGAGAASLVAASFLLAPALATPGSGFTPAPIVNGHFGTLNDEHRGRQDGQMGPASQDPG